MSPMGIAEAFELFGSSQTPTHLLQDNLITPKTDIPTRLALIRTAQN